MREGWEMKKLGEVCKYDKIKYKENNYPYVGLENIESNTGRLLRTETPPSVKSSTFVFSKNHLLYGRLRPYLNKILIPNFKGHCSSEIFPILPNDNLSKGFLYYWLIMDSTNVKINNTCTGARMPRANMKAVLKFLIPVPSLSEQKQIVALLDKAFATINQAKANLEKNIDNAKELFQSKLNEVLAQKGAGWEEKTLEEVTTKIGSGATPRGGQASYKESGISLIRSMNVHDAGFKDRKLAFIDDEQARKLNNVTIQEDDVLLNITGASVARCCVAPKEYLPARVNQHVSIIRPIKGVIHSQFLHFVLTSKGAKDKLLSIGAQGATRQAITKVQLQNFIITFPNSIEEQLKLIADLQKVKVECERLASNFGNKILELEELKKSILEKAFAGELTPKDLVS